MQLPTPSPPAPLRHLGLAIDQHTRVLDLVTGQEGVTVGGTIVHSTLPDKAAGCRGALAGLFSLPTPVITHLLQVRLEDGSTVERDPDQLIALPAGLAAPLEDFAPPAAS